MLTTRDSNGKELADVISKMEGSREADLRSARTNQRACLDWTRINWEQVKHDVEKAQREIFRDTRTGTLWRVKERQKMLVRSLPARCWAVRQVCELNRGRHTAGIDGITCETAQEKVALVESMYLGGYRPRPVRTIWIPKPNGDKRKLGIPIIKDRAMEALVLLAMNPEWEAKFEPNSYGFRPGRSAIDAVSAIHHILACFRNRKPHPGWVFDADIASCFDTIDHDALLKKLEGSPFQNCIRAWLKSGAIGKVGFERTELGTPQGGVISPLLANIALDGMERLFGIYTSTGKYIVPSERSGLNRLVALYRYADDFVVLAPSREVIESYVVPRIETFLASVGLKLKAAKTRIVNVSQGFEFLGFGFRRFYRRDGSIRRFEHFPSRMRLDRTMERLREHVKLAWNHDVKELITGINRRIIGVCNYFRWSSAHDEFAYLNYRLWQLMWQWSKNRHPTRGAKWRKHRYWRNEGGSDWVFSFEGATLVRPYKLTVKWWTRPRLRISSSPFDPAEVEYWKKRIAKWKSAEGDGPRV